MSETASVDLRVSPLSPHLSQQQLQFLLRVTPAALASERTYEIPACVTIAQAILESATAAGWGSSVLFRLANNPFGIKYSHFVSAVEQDDSKFKVQNSRVANFGTLPQGTGVKAPTSGTPAASPQHPAPGKGDSKFNIPDSKGPIPSPQSPAPNPEPYGAFQAQTWEIENGQKKIIIAQFARFNSLGEAFHAHALLLRAPRYRPAFAVRDDWKQFAERLGPKASPLDSEHCGYSTNPSYSAELIKLVNLYRLNDPRAVEWYATGRDPGNRAIEPSVHLAIEKTTGGSTNEPGARLASSI